jgi:hypothetical protein
MSKEAVRNKRGLSEHQYRAFAKKVGHKIDYNRKMKALAERFNLGVEDIQNEITNYYSEEKLPDALDLENPIWIIIAYIEQKELDFEDTTLQGMIAAEILPTHERSFLRFSDRNKLTKRIQQNYLRPDGTPLDVQAEIISETYQKEVDIEDLVEFILSHPDGPETYQNPQQQLIEQLEAHFKGITGFNLTEGFLQLFKQNFLQNTPEINYKDVPF